VVGRYGPRRAALVGVAVVLVAALGGCGQPSGANPLVGGVQDAAAQRALGRGVPEAMGQASVTVSPPNGAAGVSPTEMVTAAVTGGQLTQATLRSQDGATLDGMISPDGRRWTSSKPLKPNTSYVFTTVVRSTSGQESSTDSRFTTIGRGQQVNGKITPPDGATISAASPLTVLFDKPIGDRAAVERALVVSSAPPVKGSPRWRGDKELVWQPDSGWQPGSQVIATLNFFGKQVGPGLFGGGDLRSVFHVGEMRGPRPPDAAGDLPPSPGPPAPAPAAAPAPGSAPSAGPPPAARPAPAARPGTAGAARPGGPRPSGGTQPGTAGHRAVAAP
jgi:Bacterial Ig domain